MKHKTYTSILIITLSNLGDVVITLPLIASIKKKYPRARITVITGERAFDLLTDNNCLSEVVCYKKNMPLSYYVTFMWGLHKRRFDYVIDLRNTLIPYLLGRPGHNFKLQRNVRRVVSRYERIERIKQMLSLPDVGADGFALFDTRHHESLVRTLHSKGLFSLHNMVVLIPGARSHLKRWPENSYAALLHMITKGMSVDVVLAGDDNDRVVGEAIAEAVPGCSLINVCGSMTQKEFAALLQQARLVVSNDSAGMHLAHYYKRPLIAFFGPTDSEKYAPQGENVRIMKSVVSCAPCEDSECKRDQGCLSTIKPEEVMPHVRELLSS